MSSLVGWLVTFNGSVSEPFAGARLYSSAAFPPRTVIESSVLVRPLRHVRFSPNGGWVVICQDNFWWFGNFPPAGLIDLIQAGMQAGLVLDDIFFTPNNDWVVKWIQSDGCRLYQQSDLFPNEILDIINDLDLDGTRAELLCLAFPPPTNLPPPSPTALLGAPPPSFWASCIIICDNNNWQPFGDPPSDIITALTDQVAENFLLRSVVYSSSTGWLITMADNAYWANGDFDQWLFQQIGQAITNLSNMGLTLSDVIIEAPVRNYTLQIETIFPKEVRSGSWPNRYDTLLGEASIQVSNQDTLTSASPAPATQQMYFGNWIASGTAIGQNGVWPGLDPNTILPTGPSGPPPQFAMTAGLIQISDPRASVVFSYIFVNKGSDGLSGLDSNVQTLAKAAIQLASAGISALFAYLGTPALGSITGAILGEFSSQGFSNCDGLVAAETITMSGAALMALAYSRVGAEFQGQTILARQTAEYSNVTFPDFWDGGGKSPYNGTGNLGCTNPDYFITWAIVETDSENPAAYVAPVASDVTQILSTTNAAPGNFGFGAWPAGQGINSADSTPAVPAACVFLSNLYLFWNANDPSLIIYFSISQDGWSYLPGRAVGAGGVTNFPVAACVFENLVNRTQLYLFWTDANSKAIFYSLCRDGQTWLPGSAINNSDSTSDSPAACVFQPAGSLTPQLFLFWKENGPSSRIWFSAYAGGVDDNDLPSGPAGNYWPGGQPWPAGRLVGGFVSFSSLAAPAACVFQNQLYLFWPDASSHRILFCASSDGQNWPSFGQPINGVDTTPGAVTACVFQNQLYLFWQANVGGNQIFFSSSWDGQTWSDGVLINGTDGTTSGVAACVYQNEILLFWSAGFSPGSIFTSASQQPLLIATTP